LIPETNLQSFNRTARYDPALYDPSHAIVAPLAAVSAVDGEERLDLDYVDDGVAARGAAEEMTHDQVANPNQIPGKE
jgi:hypothetical protein